MPLFMFALYIFFGGGGGGREHIPGFFEDGSSVVKGFLSHGFYFLNYVAPLNFIAQCNEFSEKLLSFFVLKLDNFMNFVESVYHL